MSPRGSAHAARRDGPAQSPVRSPPDRWQSARTATIALLTLSNLFMTVAWYWHLRGGMEKPILLVILISWGIALIEYCLAVPANRIGYAGGWSAGQLKVVQEALALIVFAGFALLVLKEPLTWRHAGAFACLMGAVAFMFAGKG